MDNLKQGCNSTKAQTKTSEWRQGSISQQLRYHMMFESKWKYLQTVNLPRKYFGKIFNHLYLDLYEECLIYSNGVQLIVGYKESYIMARMWQMEVLNHVTLG